MSLQLGDDVMTPLGFPVTIAPDRWGVIATIKHPAMKGRENDVIKALESPDCVRRSRKDVAVYLFYRMERTGRWVCVVTKAAGFGTPGLLITAYPTDAIKKGENVWPK